MIATQTQELTQEWLTEAAVEQQPQDREEKIRSLLYLVQHIAGRVVAKLPAHVANEQRILQTLSKEEQHTLATLLGKLLSSLEQS